MSLKALIFDVDGTLAETEEAHREAFNRSFRAWGLDWHWDRDEYRRLLATSGGRERMKAFQDDLPAGARRLTEDELTRLQREKTALYGEILAAGDLELRPGVAALIGAARAAGLKLAIATTTNMPNIVALTRCCWGADPDTLFDAIAAGDEVAAKKPAPDVYRLVLSRLGLPAAACIAFEDSDNGLQAAQAAGLATVITPSIYTDQQDFAGAELVVGNLDGMSLATLGGLLGTP